MKILRNSSITVVVCAFALCYSGTSLYADTGPVVKNGSAPSNSPSRITPQELWRLGGDTDNDDEFFGVLQEIAVDAEGNVHLLDSQLHEVIIFSRDGEFVQRIGRQGEGPGEFRRPSGLFILPTGEVCVLQRRPGRIVMLTPDGEPAGNYPLPEGEDGAPMSLTSGYLAGDQVVVMAQSFERKENSANIRASLVRVNKEGNRTATYWEGHQTLNFANFVVDEKQSGGRGLVWATAPDGRVIAAGDFDAYRMTIWNPDGSVDRTIERTYEQRPRSSAEQLKVRDRITPRARRARNATVRVSETDRSIMRIFPRQDGSIWVLSSRGAIEAPSETIGVFDVYDKNGNFTDQVTITGEGNYERDGFYFVGDRLFVVTHLWSAQLAQRGGGPGTEVGTDEEAEPMEVICYDLGDIVHGMNQ